jgi:type I restriction enzyme S subunit
MSTDWREVALGDHVDLVTGFPFKSSRFLKSDEDAVKLLRGDNVGQGVLRWDGAKYWPKQETAEYEQFNLEERDVILAMDRPWIEAGLKFAWVRQSDLPCLLVQRVSRLRGINGLITDFLRYLIGSPAFTAHVKSITTGVNVPHISGKDIKRFRFSLPPIAGQRRIAGVLGAYDDLVEVNRRRIALLEQMARRLFEEWFVRERVPGDAPFTPALLGEVAEVDWGDLNTTKASYVAAGHVAYSASGPDGFLDHFDHEGPGIVLSAIGAQCGKTWLADGRWSCIKNTIVIKARDQKTTTRILFLLLRREDVWPKRGAAQPFISQGDARKVPLRLPPFNIQCNFDRLVAPMLDKWRSLQTSTALLIKSRDLLLPRLVSGELSIPAAERELGAVA